MSRPPDYYFDRRKGPDILVRWVKLAGIICWILVLTIWFIVDKAKPPFESVIERVLNIQLRSTWDYDLMKDAFYLLILLFIICVVSLIINSRRCRRKSDRYNPSLIILLISSLAGIILYLFFFF